MQRIISSSPRDTQHTHSDQRVFQVKGTGVADTYPQGVDALFYRYSRFITQAYRESGDNLVLYGIKNSLKQQGIPPTREGFSCFLQDKFSDLIGIPVMEINWSEESTESQKPIMRGGILQHNMKIHPKLWNEHVIPDLLTLYDKHMNPEAYANLKKGQFSELFKDGCPHYGYAGDMVLWNEMINVPVGIPMPQDKRELITLLQNRFLALTGSPIESKDTHIEANIDGHEIEVYVHYWENYIFPVLLERFDALTAS